MRLSVAFALAASFVCISAAEAPSEWQTYSGVRVDSDPQTQARFDRAYRHCEPQAAWQGSSQQNSLLYVTALRSCLYRQGIVDRGSYSYPVNDPFDHFIDR
ncbi:hypothetical protein ASE04_23115 [Rhizobium sp. Root708]|uniref:hypothetical protein n=1 Tax=Rhizobium sp. Root708 TaxID=1736592 RepID=UPI000700B44B|nr:hypothetical protein [Rhizobium sp. Root708]KRB61288.1 hypothetical protein ASE04_23115 [Rhizobium sp. Root708]